MGREAASSPNARWDAQRCLQTDPPEVLRTVITIYPYLRCIPAAPTGYLPLTLGAGPWRLLSPQRPGVSSQVMGLGQPHSHPPRPLHPGSQEPPESESWRAPHAPATCTVAGSRVRPSPPESPKLAGLQGSGAPGLRAAAREPARDRQGAVASSSPGTSPPRSPPPTRRPLTDFHSAVVEARGGGVQGVEAAVQRCGAAAQRGRLALELAKDVPGAARQVGELRQQADQGVRADLLQRAEERGVRGSGRLGPAQPGGLHGPLVEGHGAGRAARARARGAAGRPGPAKPLSRPPSARGASPHPTQRKVPGSGGARRGSLVAAAGWERRGGREGRTDGRAGWRAARQRSQRQPGEPRGRAPDGPSSGCPAPGGVLPPAGVPRPRGWRKFKEQLPGGGRGDRGGGEWRRESR